MQLIKQNGKWFADVGGKLHRAKRKDGIWKVRLGGSWVVYDPPDETILREADAVRRFGSYGNVSGHSCFDGGRGKKCGSTAKGQTSVEREINNALVKKYVRK